MYDYSLEELFKRAKEGTLPKDFKDWSLADETGWCVGDQAAVFGTLPEDFKDWSLGGGLSGWTIAHSAARNGNLPKNFHIDYPDIWKLKSIVGTSVEDLAHRFGYIVD